MNLQKYSRDLEKIIGVMLSTQMSIHSVDGIVHYSWPCRFYMKENEIRNLFAKWILEWNNACFFLHGISQLITFIFNMAYFQYKAAVCLARNKL